MLKVDIVSIFPAMVKGPLSEGVVGRAIARGLLDVHVHDLRDFTTDRHRVVDDVPFGGGPGMVIKPEPMFRALAAVAGLAGTGNGADEGKRSRSHVVMTSPQGTRFTHAVAERLSREAHLVFLCGRYEGV